MCVCVQWDVTVLRKGDVAFEDGDIVYMQQME